ncbi:TonB-dependent receptor [Halomonas sp. MCCC 1A17488]|uniref:TonB-dependent receptor n=1 Tax=Billgrantia sulfidoxydans TaxID=2733484 RepID=A0ABX7W339_9GAMM|nr:MULTISPECIES: TonB-dependent receptor [Halomonas]MCE8017044.1 TonB-dependent receptor [Halomonas sp. MCCC 1A17488]MCG3240377.1 TonB-dependent receptor [Halomonas sp. MCCC 1A17488]QPP49759.1 TonB-dependent receptor [Halomonas sp. SS10-MC5]QTP53369.1 TonB-dependent receptor [Halomonas sulfidoxydans]
MKTKHHLAAFGLAALPLAVQAQATVTQDTDIVALNPMVITATLAPRTADETLSSVTVLDEATLRRQDPTSVTDLLRGQPGVDVSSNGSFGKQSSVSIRGTSNNQSLLMIDGIRLRSATDGGPAWQYLDPRMFQRAEIVRGPRGSLYGADAVGGVVQLFTHDAQEGGPHPRISAGGGSFDTQRYSAGLSGSSGGTRYSFAGSHFTTDGTPVRRGGEDMGYDNTSALARMSHTFDSGAEVGFLALRARGTTEYDESGSMATTDYMQQVAGIYGELPVTDSWSSRLTLSEARDESVNHFWGSILDTQTRTARWENTLTSGGHELIIGAEYMNDSVAGSVTGNMPWDGPYDIEERDNKAVFGQALLDFEPLAVQASLRYDDNEAYGDEITGSLALGYDINSHHTLRASYGTAFKAPTFNDLYWPGFGNPELEAETSKTVELGVRGQYVRWFWDAAIYQTDIDNLIVWQQMGQPTTNVPTTRIRGVELSVGAEVDDWTLAAAATYTDPEDRATGNRLRRRSSQSARFDVDRELGEWFLGGSWVLQGYRYEDAANTDRIGGFGLVNLRAGWQFAPLWSARLTVENALDKEYVTTRFFDDDDYLNAGRAAFVSVHFGQ